MKLTLEDFNYKGVHIDHYESEMPNVKNIDDIPLEKLEEYVKEGLDEYIK